MKRLLLLLLLAGSFLNHVEAQTKVWYDRQWAEADSLFEQAFRPQSALAVIARIDSAARGQRNPLQRLRALHFRTMILESKDQDSIAVYIRQLEKELTGYRGIEAALARGMLAAHYIAYFDDQRYRIYRRTSISAQSPRNQRPLDTWSIADFQEHITQLLLASLQPAAELKRTPSSHYTILLTKGDLKTRPTLYDLLAQQAIRFFQYGDVSWFRSPDKKLELDGTEAYLPAAEFARARFRGVDTTTLAYRGLRLCQELLLLHAQDTNPAALIKTDLDRLGYVHGYSIADEKDSLYQAALALILQRYGLHRAHRAAYLLAEQWNEESARYNPPGDSSKRWKALEAAKLLRQLVADSSLRDEEWAKGWNLLQILERPYTDLRAEYINLPQQPFRILASYKNTPQLYFYILPYQEAKDSKSAISFEELQTGRALRRWTERMPGTEDLQKHSAEISCEGLPPGHYFLLVMNEPSYQPGSTSASLLDFHASNVSFVHNNRRFYVLHRETGQPLQARIDLFRISDYNDHTGTFLTTFNSNVEGLALLPAPVISQLTKGSAGIRVAIPGDTLHTASRIYLRQDPYVETDFSDDDNRDSTERERVYYFLDRSLYRPGQTVYFKGLLVRQERLVMASPKREVLVYLRNAEGSPVDSLRLTTNDYGTFQGAFQLPAHGLTGLFSLGVSRHDDASFRVEEYKRPRFEVRLNAPQRLYLPNDSVQFEGESNSYAGSALQGARVNYVVYRSASYYPGRYPYLPRKQVAQGSTHTDANGRFRIRFAAKTTAGENGREFVFQVTTDVTDISGETHSTSGKLTIGAQPLRAKLTVPRRLPTDSFHQATLTVTDLQGRPRAAMVRATLTRLQSPDRLLRDRLWDEPDQFVMTRDEYIRRFPRDPYGGEADEKNWPRLATVVLFSDSLRNDRISWSYTAATGIYLLKTEVRSEGGFIAEDSAYVEIRQGTMLPKQEYLWTDGPSAPVGPGNNVQIFLGTTTNIHLFQQLSSSLADTLSPTSFPFDSTTKTIRHLVQEQDRGGLSWHWFFVRDNRLWSTEQILPVPWSNKELNVELGTFRDRALPGSREQWRLTIKGSKGEAVAAEVLASMYDESLDQLYPHGWRIPELWPVVTSQKDSWTDGGNFEGKAATTRNTIRISVRDASNPQPELIFQNITLGGPRLMKLPKPAADASAEGVVVRGYARQANASQGLVGRAAGLMVTSDSIGLPAQLPVRPSQIQIRRDFRETSFFYPELKTDSSGSVSFAFTLPEALTRWKFQALAQSKQLALGSVVASIVTQKDLMVQPNLPRFLRQGDHLELVTKVVNMTGKELTGQVQLELFDAATGKPVDGWFQNVFPNQYFTVAANSSEAVAFPVEVPYLYNSALTWRFTARSGDFSDAEEATLPVLSSKILVTETLPLPMRGNGTKTFSFEKLLHSSESETLQQQGLTLEYTANPAWYAVQALPYLMEYPYECAEQTWNRYYANALAAHILQGAPKVRAVFERWRLLDSSALQSNLQKKEELKSALLEETPWVLQAENETQRKKNIALLFDLSKLAAGQQQALAKLQQQQRADGSFPWFEGGPSDRYITEYILSGIGHLQELGVETTALQTLRDRALAYSDAELKRDYEALRRSKARLDKAVPNSLQLLHLYARSFTRNRPGDANRAAFDYYLGRLEKTWLQHSKRGQGLIALTLHRYGSKSVPANILVSLRETAVRNEELGMYWKENRFGRSWYWQDAPIETQALLIEAFAEIGKDSATVNDLRTWLVKNKQTNNWRTTTGTADACYALLLRGSDWLTTTPRVLLQAGPVQVSSDTASEAGTGYFRKSIPGNLVRPEMGRITVQVQGDSSRKGAPSWGAAYWQYFEEMDKVTAAATPLSIERKIFREVNTDKGPQLQALETPSNLHVGDRVRVRLVLRSDRPMEYVHLKDLRASCLEPVDVLSRYRWQDGLGYYQATRDLSTNFFINYLPRGTYVFEYSLFVTHKGDFSAGLASIQCLYAPEFSAHSEGQKVTVE